MLKHLSVLVSLLVLSSMSFAHESKDLQAVESPLSGYNYSYDLEDECVEIDDPYERLNRKLFAFNSFLDHVMLRPVAKGYRTFVPEYGRERIGNALDNMTTPLTVVNNALQFKLQDTLLSFWKFGLNTVFGIGGTYDFAGQNGLKMKQQTFGSTLAYYGVAPGPYLVVPVFGPSSVRDATDIVMSGPLNPTNYMLHQDARDVRKVVSMVHKRAEILKVTDKIAETSADSYASIRSMYHQKRESELEYPKGFKKCNRAFYKK